MPGVKWRGIVAENQDPQGRFRVRAKVPDGFQDPYTGVMDLTGWLLPAHQGVRYAPPIGAGIWVEFEYGPGVDHKGIWSGEYPSIPDGVSEIINVALEGLAGNAPYMRGLYQVTTPAFDEEFDDEDAPEAQVIAEPESFQATVYPNNAVVHSPSGKAIIELDDSGPGRIHLHTGDFYHEVTGDGAEARRVGAKTEFVMESEVRVIEGPQTEHVAGTAVKHYESDLATKVDGTLYGVAGKIKLNCGQVSVEVNSDGIDLTSLTDVQIMTLANIVMLANNLVVASTTQVKLESTSILLAPKQGVPPISALPAFLHATETGVEVNKSTPLERTVGVVPALPVVAMDPQSLVALNKWIAGVTAALLRPSPSAGMPIATVAELGAVTPPVVLASSVLRAGVG